MIAVMKDVFGDRTHCGVAPGSSGEVTASVPSARIPAGVVCFTVALDDQPPVDHEVDSSDTGDVLLNLNVAPERSQQQPHQRLRTRLRAGVQQLLERTVAAGKAGEDCSDACLVHQS